MQLLVPELIPSQLIMGLAGVKTSWQRQTCYFGHDNGDKYSVLLIDNRGIGGSDKPISRYTTSDMAKDVVEVLDHVGWTGNRQINLLGISLGGMIAQEIACLIPSRLQSLSLLCTTAVFDSNQGPLDRAKQAIAMFIPKSEDENIEETARKLFPESWLMGEDMEVLPSPKSTVKCGPAPGSADGEYPRFDSNFQRFQAQEMTKKRIEGNFSKAGFFCQLSAVIGHNKSADQLRQMADLVGRDRILIMHGTRDRMIPVNNGERLIKMVKPKTGLIVDDLGHAPIMERVAWFNKLMEDHFTTWAKL